MVLLAFAMEVSAGLAMHEAEGLSATSARVVVNPIRLDGGKECVAHLQSLTARNS